MQRSRSAGLLLHITSLPSRYGIGDLGPEAKKFADFLQRSEQRHWQVLPLNPVEKAQSFSPYSSVSSMAGNTLLISPDELVNTGLLRKKELDAFALKVKDRVNFEKVFAIKEQMLEVAFSRADLNDRDFETFCNREAFWLDDFAIYMALKKKFRNKPWFKWPDEYKLRKLKSLLQFKESHQKEIDKVQWSQYTFFRQWDALKSYCNERNVLILGDLPFYISYDSVDVWSRKEIFQVTADGAIKGIAGVPPDYFNSKGQLWGMPVFKWDVLKLHGYDWWVKRIRKNLELFDELRLDHFRAFAEYWEVTAGEKTAVKGKWKQGPGADLFNVLKRVLRNLPLVAEDLGDISANVYKLRDQFGFPGMKVLQFAFGNDMPKSDHIPHNFEHNFIAYTGTHDNNTTAGWYTREIDKAQRRQIEAYAGHSVNVKNIHRTLMRLAFASIADTVIIPVQDVLGLNALARMNTPASTSNNWQWRLQPGALNDRVGKELREMTILYRRTASRIV